MALRDAAIFERRFQMFAPSLWLYEIVNGLRVAVRRGRISIENGTTALHCLLALKVQLVDHDPLDIYRIACRYDIAAYDAITLPFLNS